MADCEYNERQRTDIDAVSPNPDERAILEARAASNPDGARGVEVSVGESREPAGLEEPRRGGRRRHHSYSSLNSANEQRSRREGRGGWSRGFLESSTVDSVDALPSSGGVQTRRRSSPAGGGAAKKQRRDGIRLHVAMSSVVTRVT